jgi:hypothetical protein
MSSTCFIDPVYLSQWGLTPTSILSYFLHPLNPLRPPITPGSNNQISCNELLLMQGIVDYRQQDETIEKNGMFGRVYKIQELIQDDAEMMLQQQQQQQQQQSSGGDAAAAPPPPQLREVIILISYYETTKPTQSSSSKHLKSSSFGTSTLLSQFYILQGVIYRCPVVREVLNYGVYGICRSLGKLLDGSRSAEEIARDDQKREDEAADDDDDEDGLTPITNGRVEVFNFNERLRVSRKNAKALRRGGGGVEDGEEEDYEKVKRGQAILANALKRVAVKRKRRKS